MKEIISTTCTRRIVMKLYSLCVFVLLSACTTTLPNPVAEVVDGGQGDLGVFDPDGPPSIPPDAEFPLDMSFDAVDATPAGDATHVPEDAGDLDAVVCTPSPETCDGLDNDCNGVVDDLRRSGLPCPTDMNRFPGQCETGFWGCHPDGPDGVQGGQSFQCIPLPDDRCPVEEDAGIADAEVDMDVDAAGPPPLPSCVARFLEAPCGAECDIDEQVVCLWTPEDIGGTSDPFCSSDEDQDGLSAAEGDCDDSNAGIGWCWNGHIPPLCMGLFTPIPDDE